MSFVAPPDAVAAQRRSSDPAASVWVAANAGAGKTTVLSERVIRLLLAGVPPRAILCLTFTNAAAAEMAARVARRLGDLTRLSESELAQRVAELAPDVPPQQAMDRARTLFAEALETPGGLKIQTLHSFAQSLLRRFPLEAEVSGAFTVLDDVAEAELSERAVAEALALATRDDALGVSAREALATLLPKVGDTGIHTALRDMLRARDGVLAVGRTGLAPRPLAEAIAALEGGTMDIPPSEITDEMLRDVDAAYPPAQRGKPAHRLIEAVLHASSVGREDALRNLVMTGSNEARKRLLIQGVSSELPHALDAFQAEAERQRLILARDRASLSAAIHALGYEATKRYVRETRRRGLIGYDDQISRAADLVHARVGAAWVRHKLDEGIDHLLLDEAQDTSAAQWRLISALTEEFFVGEGARGEVHRTLFVVGDEKQSIYSFQGAAPWLFNQMRQGYRAAAEAAHSAFEEESLAHSFRSAPQILSAVDAVFSHDEIRAQLGASAAVDHKAVKAGPGGVDIWPLLGDNEAEPNEDWTQPLDASPVNSGKVRLARALADTIKRWVEVAGPDDSPPVPPGDIMVLVRSRERFSAELISSLKRLGVPSAGADRLKVTEHIAARDMMALARALISQDDLSLATVLRSPLFDVPEHDLFRLCHGRDGSLMGALADDKARFGNLHEQLTQWRSMALATRPFDFFCAVLAGAGQRQRFVARMGEEAADVLDAFLDLVLTAEQQTIPTMEAVLFRLERSEAELRRAVDADASGVRVMTVHGAKGLEAPIVVLADIGQKAARGASSTVVSVEGAGVLSGISVPLFAPNKSLNTEATRAIRDEAKRQEEAESLRLLYVAMTRAERHLVVCGAFGKSEPAEGRWHERVREALRPNAEPMTAPVGDPGEGLAWRFPVSDAVTVGAPPPIVPAPVADPAERLRHPPRPPKPAVVAWRPSDGSAHVHDMGSDPSDRPLAAAQYGTLIHDTLDRAARGAAPVASIVADLAPDLSVDDQARAVEEVEAVLALDVLEQGMVRTEVDVVGDVRWPDGSVRRVRGRIDRLHAAGDRITLIDFKTDRNLPDRAGAVARYGEQLAAYRAVLMEASPNAQISAVLVFTRGPHVMVLDQELPALCPA
ncbi:MAG: double-strand break repair helicase AddA [Pseudomonadota bacterium]